MEKYLNMGIKEIITKFPQAADILNGYNIGCVPCNVGTCLLKDIVEIHNLSTEDEKELLEKIASIIYPGKKVEIPLMERKERRMAPGTAYSPPIKKLVDEHLLIKRWLACLPGFAERLEVESEEGRKLVFEAVDFTRGYADKYHHAKEEEILFKFFDENLDIIKVMHHDHDTARAHMRAILDAVDKRDRGAVKKNFLAYAELLAEHIKKEDEILYVWMDRNLSTKQVGELFSKFKEADGKFPDAQVKYEKFIQKMEKRQKQEVAR